MFKHILVPTDFGDPAVRALDVAIELASKFESTVTLLHASWLPVFSYMAYAEGLSWPVDEMAALTQSMLDAALASARQRYAKVEGAIVHREPWHAILEVAKERACNLIVMGTHGRRGVSHVLLGSVAEKVVRLSQIPVLTVPQPLHDAATAQ